MRRLLLQSIRSLSTSSDFKSLTSMAPLNPAAQEAIHRLRNYVPPPTAYDTVPLTRRAAVLLLLYADSQGDLRIVITMRAKTLRSYAGDAALPGGRADTLAETPFQTARREAWEEIGLPNIDSPLPRPFAVEHLCEMPANLAKTELVVRPCIALLHAHDERTGESADPEVSLIPKLDAREVAAVFTAPFEQFLSMRDEGLAHPPDCKSIHHTSTSSVTVNPMRERMHQFFVRPNRTAAVQPPRGKNAEDQIESYRVFGMTARIIVDAARLAFNAEPEFEHNSHFGDEAMIDRLRRLGKLAAVRTASDELTRETMEKAAKLS
ncbi:hypothetical protein N7510_000545 [Penicillium lagena]|uniref:uncharacterized protein n=1 Tax=Penicillium lagena TaxID=94218 RepID=UPI0025424B31|nr:uncharacterized protein N7510_000545 [Penicillium lagena]KAJ5624236.1 hypothetical protein N7510_000545 [Penicillium lagena]